MFMIVIHKVVKCFINKGKKVLCWDLSVRKNEPLHVKAVSWSVCDALDRTREIRRCFWKLEWLCFQSMFLVLMRRIHQLKWKLVFHRIKHTNSISQFWIYNSQLSFIFSNSGFIAHNTSNQGIHNLLYNALYRFINNCNPT